MRRLVLALLVALGTPAGAVEVARNGYVTYEIYPDASACFVIAMAGPFYGMVTVTGVVSTRPKLADVAHQSGLGRPTDVLVSVQHIATAHDEYQVCPPGAGGGRAVHSGEVVYTVNAHGVAGDVVMVLRCGWYGGARRCV